MSTLGGRNTDDLDEFSTLKQIYYEIIDKIISEMDYRFKCNNKILNAVEVASDFFIDNFDYDSLHPLTELPIALATRKEFSVVKTYLLNERNKPEWQEKAILQSLWPVKSAFPTTYRSNRNFWCDNFYKRVIIFSAITDRHNSPFINDKSTSV